MASVYGEPADLKEQEVALARWEPKIIIFLCSWCGYTAADLAGAAQIQYPTSVRIVRIPCVGRINPLFVVKSLQHGADGVLLAGCHPGNCHYRTGNLLAESRFTLLKGLLEQVGVEPQRLLLSWVGAAEADKFARVVAEMVTKIQALGPARALVASKG